MYTFYTIIIPIILGLTIAFFIARWGRKKHIGFQWALFLGLLNPIIGSIFVLWSRNISKPTVKRSTLWKPFAVIIALYGLMILAGGIKTKSNSEIKSRNSFSEETEIVDYSNSTIIYDSGGNTGRVLVGGILSLIVDIHVFKLQDYRASRYSKIYGGLLLISIAAYIFRKRRVIPIVQEKSFETLSYYDGQNFIDQETQIKPLERKSLKLESSSPESWKESPLKIREYIMSKKLRYYRYIIYSVFTGFISGWYFKKPNERALIDLLNQRSIWKKDILLEYFEASGFFFNKYFHFNWLAFLITSLIVLFTLMFINDKGFRQYVFNKLNFRDENGSS